MTRNKQAYAIDALTEYIGKRPVAIKWVWDAEFEQFAVVVKTKTAEWGCIIPMAAPDDNEPRNWAMGIEECEFAGTIAAMLDELNWTKCS